ncbi:hypothetical protein [Phenylobacterium sp.]|nr:hypothetical protein [Phenylobacterium sp.]
MKDVIATALASSLMLAVALAALASKPLANYLERAHAGVAAEQPLQIARG